LFSVQPTCCASFSCVSLARLLFTISPNYRELSRIHKTRLITAKYLLISRVFGLYCKLWILVFFHLFMAQARNRWKKNSVRNLHYGPKTRLIRGIYEVTLTPDLTPNFPSFLLLKRSFFNSQSGVKITPKMELFLLLKWVVFTLFGVTLTLKVE